MLISQMFSKLPRFGYCGSTKMEQIRHLDHSKARAYVPVSQPLSASDDLTPVVG